jgi:hypothetical protein
MYSFADDLALSSFTVNGHTCLLPWNIWDPDINYPAPIPIIVRADLILPLSSMHALFSPPGIYYLTHRTQPSSATAPVRRRKELTRN